MLGIVFNRSPIMRKCFYIMLDLLLIRAWHIKRSLRQIRNILPDNAFVLDAGAGFGQYTYFMSKIGKSWQIKAVDVKSEQVEDCNRFFYKINRNDRIRFEIADLNTFCEPEQYHLVICIDVMEHISDDIAVFQNIHSSLKPGGILLVSTPSDLDSHHKSFICEHVRDGYNVCELRNKLTQAGFTKVEVKYTYGLFGQISWIISIKFPMMMLNVTTLFFILLPFYYSVTFPVCLLFNLWDVCVEQKSGTGLNVCATKTQETH